MLFSLRAGSRCDLCSPRLDGWLLLHLLLVDRMRTRLGSSPSLTQYRTKSKRSRSARTQQKNWPHALTLAYARRRRPPDHPRSGTLTPVTDVEKRHVTIHRYI